MPQVLVPLLLPGFLHAAPQALTQHPHRDTLVQVGVVDRGRGSMDYKDPRSRGSKLTLGGCLTLGIRDTEGITVLQVLGDSVTARLSPCLAHLEAWQALVLPRDSPPSAREEPGPADPWLAWQDLPPHPPAAGVRGLQPLGLEGGCQDLW